MGDFEVADALVTRLANLLDHEPPVDAGNHPAVEVHQIAANDYLRWQREVNALRLLIGIRLTNAALEAHRA